MLPGLGRDTSLGGFPMTRWAKALMTCVALAISVPLLLAATQHTRSSRVQHVLLISVDGLHALDVANYVHSHPNSALAELASHGVTYSNARTPANSDSFPGLLALMTGG